MVRRVYLHATLRVLIVSQPRFAAEKARSPERIPYHSRCKPATPIEIPRRPRFMPSPVTTPMEQSSSPDLIFEMSPTSSNFPIHAMDDHQPFMYSVPIFQPRADLTWPRRKAPRQGVMPSRQPAPAPVEAQRSEPSPSNVTDGTECRDIPRTQSTTKITGFCPINADQPSTLEEPPKPLERLSPPPRKSSYFPSPWLLPGRSDRYDEDISYSLADPAAFEFQRHLLRRIENKDSSRFASLRSCL